MVIDAKQQNVTALKFDSSKENMDAGALKKV